MVSKTIKYRCPECLASTAVTPMNKYRKHKNEKGEDCRMTGQFVPPNVVRNWREDAKDEPKQGRDFDVCPACDRKARLDDQGAFKGHLTEAGGTEQCLFSGKLKNGKNPPSLEDEIPMNGGSQQSFTGGDQIPCPNPDCGRPNVDIQADGTIGVHMRVEWGDKVCPMSNHKPEEWPLEKVYVPEPMGPKRVERLSSDPGPEIQALAAAFPQGARTPDSTTADSATPALADAPDTNQPTIPGADTGETKTTPAVIPDAPSDASTPSAPPTDNTPARYIDSRGPNSAERCEYCDTQLGGTHKCYPRFVPAGEPESPFVPAGEVPRFIDSVIPMDLMAEQLTARLREMFYAYSNRMDRTVQETLGPSEIGTPCDRRLAMSLLRIPPVNPGGDNWASFVGTCVHVGLAEMFMWADANQGRFAVEVPLEYPSQLVPHGTSDVLDRVLCMVDDHKLMGRWSLDKLRLEGIKPLYKVQLHVYGYGQKLKGEKITHVALIGWPREQATLADLYVVVEPYDESIALDAFKRVEEINRQVSVARAATTEGDLWVARQFDIQDDCRFCPFYAKGDSMMERGCNGKR